MVDSATLFDCFQNQHKQCPAIMKTYCFDHASIKVYINTILLRCSLQYTEWSSIQNYFMQKIWIQILSKKLITDKDNIILLPHSVLS